MILQETVSATDADGRIASLQVWVSDGESEPGQTVMEYNSLDEYVMICLDQDGARHLRAALDRMLTHHQVTEEIKSGRIREMRYAP